MGRVPVVGATTKVNGTRQILPASVAALARVIRTHSARVGIGAAVVVRNFSSTAAAALSSEIRVVELHDACLWTMSARLHPRAAPGHPFVVS